MGGSASCKMGDGNQKRGPATSVNLARPNFHWASRCAVHFRMSLHVSVANRSSLWIIRVRKPLCRIAFEGQRAC